MLTDANLAPSGSRSADVCIIGGGVAGLSLAAELAKRGRSVVLCEGGEAVASESSSLQYVGESRLSNHLGESKRNDGYLVASRLRMLGGTANHWGGSCTFLDSDDFVARDWINFSGWPISKSDLEPHYVKACRLLRIRYPGMNDQALEPAHPVYDVAFSDALVNTFKQRTTFATRREVHLRGKIDEVASSDGVNLVVNANLVAMQSDASGSVSSAHFASYSDRRLDVRAKTYVLACGGIENARLLLHLGPSLGLRNDNIGRYFMEHLVFQNSGALHLTRDRLGTALYDHPKAFEGYLELSPKSRARRGLLGLKVGLQQTGRPSPHLLDSYLVAGSQPHASEALPLRILIAEQSPNPESRVLLAKSRDRFGIPRVALDWRTRDIDHRSIVESVGWIAREFGAAGRGRIRFDFPGRRMLDNAAGYHHMGTTRMSRGPESGVVDPNLRIFGTRNAFVTGSSVFPTSGSAHPTVTLLALTDRLAAHLDDEALS